VTALLGIDVGSGGHYMDLHMQLLSGSPQDPAHVRLSTEPQAAAEREASGECLGNEPSTPISSSELRCFVQDWTRVEHLKDFWMWESDAISSSWA
jgi:hypothetical protein